MYKKRKHAEAVRGHTEKRRNDISEPAASEHGTSLTVRLPHFTFPIFLQVHICRPVQKGNEQLSSLR